jgi:hypothetical protein
MKRVCLPIKNAFFPLKMASLQKVVAGLQNESAHLQNDFANTMMQASLCTKKGIASFNSPLVWLLNY